MKLNRVVITVDGLAGSGKTTLSRELAKKLGFAHLNSGALYRTLAYLAIKSGTDLKDGHSVSKVLDKHKIVLTVRDGETCVLLDGAAVGTEIRVPEVSEATSVISAHPQVRTGLRELQRNAFLGQGLVAEGRDMGTVIFPDAQLKFFIQADLEIRIKRRLLELNLAEKRRYTALKEGMQKEIADRDRRDEERQESPTVAAPDALIIDNGRQKLTEVVQRMYDCAAQMGLVKP